MVRIGLTVGDVGGIGPEVIVKAICRLKNLRGIEYLVFSPECVFDRFRGKVWAEGFFDAENVRFVPVPYEEPLPQPGEMTKEGGILAYNSIVEAVKYAMRKDVSAVVTAPISKYGCSIAKEKITGHTELLQKLTNSKNTLMLFWGRKLKIALITTHIPLKMVPSALSVEIIISKIQILAEFLKRVKGGASVRLAVLGLNPHCGDGGIIGSEEKDIISVAVDEVRRDGFDISGPFPSDGFFGRGLYRGYDAVLALYHDQGLIPFKMLEPAGVNLTLGLPFIRTSPIHGTAYDIAPQFVADPLSMVSAIRLAYRLAKEVYKGEDKTKG